MYRRLLHIGRDGKTMNDNKWPKITWNCEPARQRETGRPKWILK
jgi:hypothetical protein